MASIKHLNTIRIARGDKAAKTPSFAELFYDTKTQGVYIGNSTTVDGNTTVAWKRFGGFDSLVIKGTIAGDTAYSEISKSAEPGDTYIITDKVSVVMPEVTFDNKGGVTRNENNLRLYDDFFKNGQVIIFTDEDVSAIPSAAVVTGNSNGVKGAVTLAGTQNSTNLEYDPEKADELGSESEIRDVQTALDLIFNTKQHFIGYTQVNAVTLADQYESEDAALQAIYDSIAEGAKLKQGQTVIYNGSNTKITVNVNGTETVEVLKKNTALINNAGTIYAVPLGASSASDVELKFSDARKSDEDTAQVKTVDVYGNSITLDGDKAVTTVQQAIDSLHQTKADLNAQGKIPLSQIPATMIGALQYCGTIDVTEQAANETITAKEFAKIMSQAKGGWEKEGEGAAADKAYSTLDSGDYVIVSITTVTKNEDGDNVSTQLTVTDDSGAALFKISNGDHVITNSVTYEGDTISAVTLDHLDSSAAVDAVNGIQGTVIIEAATTPRTVTDKNGASTTVSPITVATDGANNEIEIDSAVGVVEDAELPANTIPIAQTGRNLVEGDLSYTARVAPDTTEVDGVQTPVEGTGSNTKITGKAKDGTSVSIEFPDEGGKIVVNTGTAGTKNVVAKFNGKDGIVESELTSEDGLLTIQAADGTNLKISYTDLAKFLQFSNGKTRLFDGDSDVINTKNRTFDENTHVILDDCSVIDGGDWTTL